MNELPETTDLQKLYEAVQCIRKTVKCSVCLNSPTEAHAGKCGHPFCKNCGDTLLRSKKALCSICKAVIIRSAVHSVESIDKIVKDLESLCAAIEKDSDTIIRLDKPQGIKQCQGKRKSLTLPGPSGSKIEQESSSRSDLSREKLPQQNKGRRLQGKKVARQKSIDSEATIKIQNRIAPKKSETHSVVAPSVSKTTNIISEPVFTADNLPIKIGAIGYKEKVEGWLNAEEFENDVETDCDLSEPSGSKSPAISEILESFSQLKPNSRDSTRSERNSWASKTPNKNEERQGNVSAAGTGQKFPSFTFEATDKTRKTSRKSVTPAEEMFEDLKRKPLKEQSDNKKSRVPSISADSSWSELARLKKEARPKVRKRSRLNVSLERPSSAKPIVDSLDCEDSEEERESKVISSSKDGKNKSNKLNKATFAGEESAKKRQKPALVSERILEPGEMIDISNLNRSQVKEIIGVFDDSKNSSNSPDKSPIKSNRNKLSLRRSGDNVNELKTASHYEESSRPESKQSFHAESRPGSRLSYKSNAKSSAEKFRLSTQRRSTTPNLGLAEVTTRTNFTQQGKREQEEKIQLGSDSPVRVCNDFIKNKLSLKRLSSGSSKATDRENKSSANVPIKKLGKLHKIRNRIKFIFLGSIRPRPKMKELLTTTCDAMTQTSPLLPHTVPTSTYSNRKRFSSESISRTIIPETRTVSAASTDSKQIKEAQIASSFTKARTIHESHEEFDTINKVNMLSPEKDSQLKFLATKSPSVPRMGSVTSDCPVPSIAKSSKSTKESSFTNLTVGTSGLEEYSRAVKKCAENLIVTDSEDQDTPNEDFKKIKRRNNRAAGKNRSDNAVSSGTTSLVSKTASGLSDLRMADKTEAATNSGVSTADKSPSLRSVENNSGGNLSRASSRKKRRPKDLLGSQAKKRDTGKLKSLTKIGESCHEQALDSDVETVLLEKTKNQDVEQRLEDSEASAIIAKHKVVRKLKYSQESGPSTKTNTGSRTGKSLEQRIAADEEKLSSGVPEKKTFQRIRRISSTDSEELLEISLTTKQSSSNSQTIQRPGPSREVNKSPILSEDMTVIFSSNKDTQESKRKRSPSPNSLDNHDLQAIASNWCADLDRSSEEILLDNNEVLGPATGPISNGGPQKKPRVEVQDSPASISIDNFPALSPTAIYGKRRKSNEVIEKTAETNDQSSLNEESELIDDLAKVAAQFDAIDAETHSEKGGHLSSGRNSNPTNNTRHIDLAGNVECSIKRGNTFNGMVTTTRGVTPIKAKSLEDRELSLVHRQSQNSDKENEVGSQGVKKRMDNKGVVPNTGQKVVCDEDLHDLEAFFISDKSEADKTPKSNAKNVPSKTNSTNNTEPFESSFDRDCLNITQEQMLMQELEENLLGRRSKDVTKTNSQEAKQTNLALKSLNKNTETNLSGKKAATTSSVSQKARGYEIAQINTDDSETMDEEIIENTPEKNIPFRKDTQVENSQRSVPSPKSFMSQDMTPISKTLPKQSRLTSEVSMLSEKTLQPLSSIHSLSKNLKAGPSGHSTPKPATSASRISNLRKESDGLKSAQNQSRKLCFVCSYLTLPEVQIVKAFARRHNVEYTATYKPEVTHVIVETNDRDSAGRTLKYLLGVAHRKWIVSFRWVTDSMRENKILEETEYEAVDSESEEPGPRRSRLRTKGLFEEFAFVFMKPFSDITIDQLEDLISSTGGTVVKTLEDLASVENKHKLILYNSEIHEPAVLENWRKKGNALPVQVEWVLSCISQYELVSLRYYLHTLDIELLPNMGLPAKLTAEEEDSCSVDEPSTTSNTA